MAGRFSTSTPAAAGRRLVRAADRAALATRDPAGWPHAALVLTACDHQAAPLLLLSDLAEHTRQLRADPRVALLFDGTAGLADPLSGSRCTLLGQLRESHEPRHRVRFLSRHPHAAGYAGFADFRLYRLTVTRVHLIGGFARAARIETDAWHAAIGNTGGFPGLESGGTEADIVARINEFQPEAVRLAATRLLGLTDGPWRLTGLDPEGCDLRLGPLVGRLDLGGWLAGPGEVAMELLRRSGVASGAAGCA